MDEDVAEEGRRGDDEIGIRTRRKAAKLCSRKSRRSSWIIPSAEDMKAIGRATLVLVPKPKVKPLMLGQLLQYRLPKDGQKQRQ